MLNPEGVGLNQEKGPGGGRMWLAKGRESAKAAR